MLEGGKWVGPIIDQHLHLDRSNRFIDAVSEFKRFGGTALMLVHKPAFSKTLPKNIQDYREVYSETISMAEEIRKSLQLKVGVVLGPHPVAWEKQIDDIGIEKSSELHLEAISLALEHIDLGNANCLGEVGRPHYRVSDERWDKANDILMETLSMAASEKTSVQLHVEDNGAETCRELSEYCESSRFPLDRAIRHYAPPDVSSEFTHGLSATVNMGKGSIENLVRSARLASAPWGMETDFLDDSSRPGAVLGPKTVPKRTHELCSKLLSSGWLEDEVETLLTNIHEKWPNSLYGI